MSKHTIVLATHNKHKRDELAAMLGDGGEFDVQVLPDDFPEIEETGTTLEENAIIKAEAVFARLKLPTIADDTGLVVEALDGAPGVYTARYAGEHATYADNCRKLLDELEGATDRVATFKTVLCYIDAAGNRHLVEGRVDGMISNTERGSNGFGYDPVFEPDEGGGKTFAELTSEEKNRISHRARAVLAFSEWMRNRMKS